MARLSRICLPGISQHIIQRGINREACFASEDDFAAYSHCYVPMAEYTNQRQGRSINVESLLSR